jgi:hypothetical protein
VQTIQATLAYQFWRAGNVGPASLAPFKKPLQSWAGSQRRGIGF